MRTAILFGLLIVGDSLSAQTGYVMSERVTIFSAVVLGLCIIGDFIELSIKIKD